MIEASISVLETAIKELEEKLENDDDDEFISGDEFQGKYDALKEIEERVRGEVDSMPYDTASEERLVVFDSYRKRFEKCEKRIKKIEDETDINAGDDSDWMFDNDD